MMPWYWWLIIAGFTFVGLLLWAIMSVASLEPEDEKEDDR